MDGKMALYCEKVAFVDFRGTIVPMAPPDPPLADRKYYVSICAFK